MEENCIRIVVIKIEKPYCSEVYDEVITTHERASDFIQKYTDMKKYIIVTV